MHEVCYAFIVDQREALLAEVAERYNDAFILRRWQNTRALLRRKLISDRLRARLEVLIPEIEAQAKARNLTLSGWRRYPDKDGNLTFGIELAQDELEFVEPKRQKPKRKPKPRKSQRRDTSPGDLLEQLEQSLAQQMKGS